MRFPGFVGPGYTLQSVVADCQRCIGWFPEINELRTQADQETATLVQFPGYSTLMTLGAGPIRGIYLSTVGKLAVVSGNSVYKVWKDVAGWHSALSGTLLTSTGPVSMIDNGSQLMITDGPYGYIISLVTGEFTKIESGFLGAPTVVFQDGYFLANIPSTGQFAISDLYDGFSWNALDFGVAEGSPDNLVAIVSSNRQIWLMGELTTEVWYNSGDSNFPFTRIDGTFIEIGCAAAATAKKFENTVVWLGGGPHGNGVVWMAVGFRPKPISNRAVELAIQKAGDLSTATAFTYQENGHAFYALNIPGADSTWIYDAATEQWSERIYWNAGIQERHRVEHHALVHGEHIVGDYANGKIYLQSTATFTDDGAPLVRIRRSPHLSANMLRIFFSKFQLDAEVGVGLDGSPVVGGAPKVELRWSEDYGKTWTPYISEELGGLGDYRTRLIWTKLGQSYNRVFEIRVTDPIKTTILGAEIMATEGRS